MPLVIFAIDAAKLPADRLALLDPINTRSALSVIQVSRCAAVAASNKMPLTRWPFAELRPAGAAEFGRAKKPSQISSRCFSLPQSVKRGWNSAARSNEDFCSSALLVAMALRDQSM